MSNTTPIIYSLAQQYLQHRKIKLAHILTLEKVNQAIAASGAGLDHTLGEQVIAIGDDSYRDEFDMFFMLTTRRLAGRVLHENRRKFFNIEFSDLMRLPFDFLNLTASIQRMLDPSWIGMQATTLSKSPKEIAELLTDIINVTNLPDAVIKEPMKKSLINFLAALKQVPAEQLLPAVQPLVSPNPDDPTGAEQLLQMIQQPQSVTALRIVSAAYKKGLLPAELGADFAARVALVNRTTLFGRGQKHGWWLSPLSQLDLGFTFYRLFGNPAYYHQQAEVQVYDFDIKNSGGGKALASSAVGIASAALLGVGWVSMPGKSITNLRVKLLDTPPTSGFAVYGLYQNNYVPLYAVRYDLFQQIAQTLVEQESNLTLLRCAFGWQTPAHELSQVPPTAVAARLEELESSQHSNAV